MPIGIQFGVTLEAPHTTPVYPRLDTIRTEGDSLMNGAYGVSVKSTLGALVGPFSLTNTALGASTMEAMVERFALPENAPLLPQTTVFWDGAPNGITSVAEYVDLLGHAIAMLGHDRFVVIPALLPYGGTYAGSEAEEIYAEMQSRWPQNVLDWRDWLDNAAGSIAQSEFYDAPADAWHLSQAGIDHMSIGITQFLRRKGWLPSHALLGVVPELLTPGAWQMDATGGVAVATESPDGTLNLRGDSSNAAFSGYADQSFVTVPGQVYKLKYSTIETLNYLRIGTSQGGANILSATNPGSTGDYQYIFTATTTLTWVQFAKATTADIVVHDISCKATDGDDLMLSSGTVWMFDPANAMGAFAGVPAHGATLPNVAWSIASSVIGAGNATTLGTHVSVVDTNAGADIFAERTGKKGLHVILSQDSAYVGATPQGFKIAPASAIQSYLDAHTEDDWYFSVWFAVTRDTTAASAHQSPMHKANDASNYLFHMQQLDLYPQSGSALLGSASLPTGSELYGDETLGEALFRAIGTTGYTGTKPSLTNGGLGHDGKGLGVALGAFDSWSAANDGKAPSMIVYRAYAENLSVSGRSYAQAEAIDQILWRDAFSSTGRFGGDTWSDPNASLA